jgi:hypothetical protein
MKQTISKEMKVFTSNGADPGAAEINNSISVDIDTDKTFPDALKVGTLYLASKNAKFQDRDDFLNFEEDFKKFNLAELAGKWKDCFDKKNDPMKLFKFISAGAREVIGISPASTCPRCGHYVWPEAEPLEDEETGEEESQDVTYYRRCMRAYSMYPHPKYCLYCGQLFKTNKAGDLAFHGVGKSEDISKWLNEKIAVQPTLDDMDYERGINSEDDSNVVKDLAGASF